MSNNHLGYRNITIGRFRKIINDSQIKLEGKVLDLFSGDVSIASIIGKEKVFCYEFNPEFVRTLTKKGIYCIMANIVDSPLPSLPFKDNAFDYCFCSGPPMKPSKNLQSNRLTPLLETQKTYVNRIISEIIRGTKKQAIISSIPFSRLFPREYKHIIQKQTQFYTIVLDCS